MQTSPRVPVCIDWVRLGRYEPRDNTVTIRCDDTGQPGFWMTIVLDLDKLAAWVQLQKNVDPLKQPDSI